MTIDTDIIMTDTDDSVTEPPTDNSETEAPNMILSNGVDISPRDAERDVAQQDQVPMDDENATTRTLDSKDTLGMNNENEEHLKPLTIEIGMTDDILDESRAEATFQYKIPNFCNLREASLSPPVTVRNLGWKIMVMPRGANHREGKPVTKPEALAFFLQCNGESESPGWSCQAHAELTAINQKNPENNLVRKINHLFHSKENDWGFSQFTSWTDFCDPEKGFVHEDGSVTFQAKVHADAPHGVHWDSKKYTGYVGIKNLGATCYMNSLLQVLYFTNILRKYIYLMPTEADDSIKSVPLALQRLFHDMQFGDKPVGTKKLTKSFGWETLDQFAQHDAQEFLRVLLDKLEEKMKKTSVQGIIPKLMEGKTLSFIKCKNVDYTSSRPETFYDIQLNVKGHKTLLDSFRQYVKTESLDGDNKYDAGPDHGLQDADKGTCFTKFPPILYLHLLRFQYDPVMDASVKFNDRFEFDETLDLNEFINKDNSAPGEPKNKEEKEAMNTPKDMSANGDDPNKKDKTNLILNDNDDNVYVLQSVLVHSGDNHGGHYVVYINPNCDGKWCKFDDDVVSKCPPDEAIQSNFGGSGEETEDNNNTARSPVGRSTNAYMLVYIRKSLLDQVICDVNEDDIPEDLTKRIEEEKAVEAIRKKNKDEAHLYMTIRLIEEDAFAGHQGNDLFDYSTGVVNQEIRVKKEDTLKVALETISAQMKIPLSRLRPWPIVNRSNHTFRPCCLDIEENYDKQIAEISDMNTWFWFLETASPHLLSKSLPPFDKERDVLLFFKYYDPKAEKIHYSGHLYVSITSLVSSLFPELIKRAGLLPNTKIELYEEIKPDFLERIERSNIPLEHALEELMDGDIIVFQREIEQPHQYRLPTARDYFKDLFCRVDVTFGDKNIDKDPGFTLTLSTKTSYQEMVKAVSKFLVVDPNYLQFFRFANFREIPIKCAFDGTVKDLLANLRPRQQKRISYQRLTMPIHERENKKQVKCIFLDMYQKEPKELVFYPNQGSSVKQLLEEAKRHVSFDNTGLGSKRLRLLEIVSHKIFNTYALDTSVNDIPQNNIKSYRIEEIPLDQVSIGDDEMLIQVTHFQQQVNVSFGHPFFLKIKEDESFETVKERIRTHLNVSETDFEKYKLALVKDFKTYYFEEENIQAVKLKELRESNDRSQGANQNPYKQIMPFIGLQHTNEEAKRARYSYVEKAVKIN